MLRDVKHFVKDYHGEQALAAQGAALAFLLSALHAGCRMRICWEMLYDTDDMIKHNFHLREL